MKEEKLVISRKNLPSKFPLSSTVLAVLALDYWNAAQWVWTLVLILMALLWLGSIINIIKSEDVDILKYWIDTTNGTKKQKSKFQQRLENAMEKAKNK